MTTTRHAAQCATAHLSHRSWARRLLDRLSAAQALHKQRLALSQLDDVLLRDIGVTRSEANAEVNRPIWDAPNHWRN